ncbi:ATP dependent peptidase CodWX, CodW component. Threonine peptidase. MEROPS family T01B [Caldanaerobius fijiensis DSM 17918]|uniref:ATP-dependent protease subunit HslV n=1 Tax=Caldanaerobius fijiensis DSM 17918 TaxID=1121256 RepID=A0A1M4XPP5_9THEO|nr:ATP-dependent protease subunit HslV [Caldanaerobius fijiensis]SHE95391.1 ATP dependent peptidase CodWX, CodW component. Threonine peptidase. MEROPS family T01B [Caldanaerobius fijiensis DSM 17918]
MIKATTIVAVKKGDSVAMAGDGQVTFGENTILKHTAKKIRKIYHGKILVGFAGSVADAFTLYDMFEEKLDKADGNLRKAAVELASEWRSDRVLRKLEALLLTADKEQILLISGSGEVIQPDHDVIAIGSGGNYAFAAAKALIENTDLSARDIAVKAMEIAAAICVYTNNNISVEEL